MAKRLVAAVLCAAIVMGGCSHLFMETVPPEYNAHIDGTPHCTATGGFAAWDTALGLLHVIGGVAFVGFSLQADSGKYALVGLLDVALAIGHFSSSRWGANQADHCRKMRAEFERVRALPVPPPLDEPEPEPEPEPEERRPLDPFDATGVDAGVPDVEAADAGVE